MSTTATSTIVEPVSSLLLNGTNKKEAEATEEPYKYAHLIDSHTHSDSSYWLLECRPFSEYYIRICLCVRALIGRAFARRTQLRGGRLGINEIQRSQESLYAQFQILPSPRKFSISVEGFDTSGSLESYHTRTVYLSTLDSLCKAAQRRSESPPMVHMDQNNKMASPEMQSKVLEPVSSVGNDLVRGCIPKVGILFEMLKFPIAFDCTCAGVLFMKNKLNVIISLLLKHRVALFTAHIQQE
ncbi:hypothetical protein B0H14DRAFT_2617219 [Mycena olivaceomarginata]|nr:hypothetical protein B0H14DRAFT_2617219 [Mycena olivaceomarginata]